MSKRISTVLVALSVTGLLVTASGHGFLGTRALLEELRKSNVNAEWIAAIKAIWILVSVDLVFFSGLVAAIFFWKNPISSRALASSIASLLLVEAAYLFYMLGVFPGAVLMFISSASLLAAARISSI